MLHIFAGQGAGGTSGLADVGPLDADGALAIMDIVPVRDAWNVGLRIVPVAGLLLRVVYCQMSWKDAVAARGWLVQV